MNVPVASRSPFRTTLAGAMAAVYLLAAVSFSVHLATVDHELCAVHGELVHPGTDASTHGHRDGAAPGTPGDAALASGESPSTHDHCSLSQHRPGDAAEIGSAASALARTPATDGARWPQGAPVFPGIDRTSVAPKQSPPVA